MKTKMKHLLLLAALLFLVSACGKENAKQATAKEDKAEVSAEETEEVFIPSTEEEWQATLTDSEWYIEAAGDREILFEEFVDFDGDGIKEYIMGTNSLEDKIARTDIGQYVVDTQEWQSVSSEVHEFSMYTEPKFHGVLDNGNNQEVAVVSVFSAGGSHAYEEMKLLALRPNQNRLIIAQGFEDVNEDNMAPHTYLVNKADNSLTITSEFSESTYKLDNGSLFKDDTEVIELDLGRPVTVNEEFKRLLDNDFFASGVYFGDQVDDAKRINPDWIQEGEVEGGFTLEYEDYALIHGYNNPSILNVFLYNFNGLLVEELETFIGQNIEVTTYFNEIEAREITQGEFVFEGYTYLIEGKVSGENVLVERIIIRNNDDY